MGDPFPAIHIQACDTRPTELMVFGERNSGTNLVHALLRRNIPAFADSPGDRIGKHGFRYGWKHGFPQMLSAPDHCLAIGVFRHPEQWLRAMHARPWHAVPDLRDLPFEDFIRAEWHTHVDEKNFGIEDGDPRAFSELQWDRHPLTGVRFEHILALRNAKTAGFLSLPQRFGNCLLITSEMLLGFHDSFVGHVAEAFALEQRETFHPVEERRGKTSDGVFVPSSYAELTQTERAFVWSQLDTAQETKLGYAPLGH